METQDVGSFGHCMCQPDRHDSEDRSTQKDTSSSAVTSSLSDLIARLEKATGPDRQLDCEIAEALGHSIVWKQANYTMEAFPAILWRKPHPYAGMKEPCPKWTSSIDAAMTLVPEGWRVNSGDFSVEGRFAWMLTLAGQPRTEWFARRRSMTDDYDGDPLYMSGRGKTLSIALCIAALKASSLPAI